MTKAQIKEHQRAVTDKWLELRGGQQPPRQRLVVEMARRGFRGNVYPNRARRWAGTEPMRLKTAY